MIETRTNPSPETFEAVPVCPDRRASKHPTPLSSRRQAGGGGGENGRARSLLHALSLKFFIFRHDVFFRNFRLSRPASRQSVRPGRVGSVTCYVASEPRAYTTKHGTVYWLEDGFHRHAAHKAAGLDEIEADVRQGTRRDAILHSVGANANHGIRRTNADKKRAVMVLLNDREWSAWSDREIARQCQVDHKTVSGYRDELDPSLGNSPVSEPRTYTTKHGTVATMNTANIGGGSKDDQLAEPRETSNAPHGFGNISPLHLTRASVQRFQAVL